MTHPWQAPLDRLIGVVGAIAPLQVTGTLSRVTGLTLEGRGCRAPIGAICRVGGRDGPGALAEVVGFDSDRIFLMPIGSAGGLHPGDRVIPRAGQDLIAVGDDLLGRVIGPSGEPLDGLGAIRCDRWAPLQAEPANPLRRRAIDAPLDVGVRAINALTTLGVGQRIGLFAPAGVGKSMLLGMFARFTAAEVIVVGLVGERGREVGDFVTANLGAEGLRKTCVVAAPADLSSVSRLRGALVATAVAEYFRDRGRAVLLLVDSLTRFAHAQREIALAVGEPPATKGYPPSVFARIGQLVERAGNGVGAGSITAVYTVLTDADPVADPIAEAARSVLDGHIVLSRELADSGHYPAIDVLGSVSRVMPAVCAPEQLRLARVLRRCLSLYQRNVDLLRVGAYSVGQDRELDVAVAIQPALEAFLQQDSARQATMPQSLDAIRALFAAVGQGDVAQAA